MSTKNMKALGTEVKYESTATNETLRYSTKGLQ
jgi:hypothetical protein